MREIPCSQTNQTVTEKYQFLPPAGNGRGGVNTCRNGTGACVAITDTQRQNSGWGCTCRQFGIFQFVAKFATGRSRREG
jgi:hypothetical protein